MSVPCSNVFNEYTKYIVNIITYIFKSTSTYLHTGYIVLTLIRVCQNLESRVISDEWFQAIINTKEVDCRGRRKGHRNVQFQVLTHPSKTRTSAQGSASRGCQSTPDLFQSTPDVSPRSVVGPVGPVRWVSSRLPRLWICKRELTREIEMTQSNHWNKPAKFKWTNRIAWICFEFKGVIEF